jgi:hypothetical protein
MDFSPSFGLESLAAILNLKKEFSDSLQSPFYLCLISALPFSVIELKNTFQGGRYKLL